MTRTAFALRIAPLLLCAVAAQPVLAQTQPTAEPPAVSPAVPQSANSTADASAAAAVPALNPDIPLVPKSATWDTFNGQLNAQKYSPLDQINTGNVGKLKLAWQYHTGDMSDGTDGKPPSVWSATPIFANDTLYLGTPFYRILAFDPGTGKLKWSYDPHAVLKALTQPDLKNRGVAYWQAKNPVAGKACQKTVYIGTMDAKLHAVDADTGKPCADFADNGTLDVNRWNKTNDKWPLSLLQPPTVFGDKLIIGWAGKDWDYEQAPPGSIFAVDARTGKLDWTLNFIPKEERDKTGTANVWASMSVDPQRGILYVPVSSPSPNYWGGNRTAPIPLGTSVTAVDINTGKVIWSRQIVHHDIWDYDTNAAPTLMDIEHDGKTIPALVQTSKMGFIFALNRLTGEPIWPIKEMKVPTDTDATGEKVYPTQPVPTLPQPLNDIHHHPEVWGLADAVSLGECSRMLDNARYEGLYTPPSTKGTGSIAYPGTAGGIEWGGAAYDPQNSTLVVNSSSVLQLYKLIPKADFPKYKNVGAFHEQAGAPYGVTVKTALNSLGMPCWKPPFGELTAIDMKTGERLWQKPLGEVQKWGFYMPHSWGSPTIGAPAVTAGGLIFIGATMDQKVRAIDLKTGETLWSAQMMAPTVASPAIYEYKGREYVAFASGGNTILKKTVGDQVAVFALPEGSGS